MIILETNNQTKFRIPRKKLTAVLNFAQKTLKFRGRQLISFAFVSETVIKKNNKIYRGKDKITDVLSFGSALQTVMPGEPVGEILICPKRAKKQSIELGHGFEREIATLGLHGYLHVMGFDHEIDADAEKMEKLERRILKNFYD
jgi:probable rRNA maturation factor